MKRDDIIRMAREAGWPGIYAKPLFSITMQEDDFLRFAALVAAAAKAEEREACLALCKQDAEEYAAYYQLAAAGACRALAQAIAKRAKE